MQNIITRTVKDIAVSMPATVRVFEEFNIDYCCGGSRPLEEACHKAGVEPSVVSERIAKLIDEPEQTDGPAKFDTLTDLIWHILSCHHVFTAQELSRLGPLMDKVAARHGAAHPELLELKTLFNELSESLTPHMRKEENVLFPYIEKVEAAVKAGLQPPTPHFGTVRNPVRMMMTEHDTDGERLRKMREVTAGYTPPEGACTSFMALYAGLEDLERDLHRHIHLENNVLFPAAIALES